MLVNNLEKNISQVQYQNSFIFTFRKYRKKFQPDSVVFWRSHSLKYRQNNLKKACNKRSTLQID